ncbi:unnamed protein product [Cunninghamella echinulata]
MNRLPFKSFHSSHFNSNNINQWNFYLQNLQQYQYDPYTQQRFYPNENEYNEFNQYEEILTHEPERNEELSKEAIAIFKFSEAYAKRQKEEEEEINTERECMEKNKTNWILDEYSSFHDNGIEAPVTSLVILSKQFSIKIRMIKIIYLLKNICLIQHIYRRVINKRKTLLW